MISLNLLVNGMKIKSLVLEFTLGLMEECIKEIGKKSNNMGAGKYENEYLFNINEY